MSAFVSFQNPGLIPIEAITVMGVNAKENENAIGFFGTGLKYSIAALLRTRQKITIYRGLDKYEFEVLQKDIRGKEFGFIRMVETLGDLGGINWRELGFTTHLGAKWELWQIFRELYSNTLDEKGDMELRPRSPKEGFTTIIVEGEAFFDAAQKKKEIFLEGEPIYTGDFCEVYPNRSNTVYYRGVKAYTLNKPTKYTYNITCQTDLTEDRTIQNEWYIHYYITQTIMKSENEDFIEESLFNATGLEDKLDYSSVETGETFAKKVIDLAERGFLAAIPNCALVASEKWAQNTARVRSCVLSVFEEEQLAEALSFLLEIGFEVKEEIIVTQTLGPDIWGLARGNKIMIARATLDKGGNWLAGTILEEHLHTSQGFQDESRRFQNFLFDLAIRFAREAVSLRKAIA